ncbi:MAG: alpha/beta hydrolase fold domain-containing protein [Solirubrobacteraceae bacterium]
MFEEFLRQQPLPEDIRLKDETLGGAPVVKIVAPGAVADRRILYFHGGVFAFGSARSGAGLAGLLARQARATALSVDDRLAPEHPYPAAIDDSLAAYQGLLETGVPPAQVAFVGESAGGGLALAALVAARLGGLAQPAAAVLFSPWVDLTLSGASMATKAAVDVTLTPDGLRRRVGDYVGVADPATSTLSPLFADLRGIAPLLIQAGSYEVLLDDATRLAGAAAAADVAVQLDVTPGVPHVFQAFAALLDEGGAALSRAGAFLKAHFEPTALS